MSGSGAVFAAIGVIGFGVLLISLLLGEISGHDLEHDVSHDLGHEPAAELSTDPGYEAVEQAAAGGALHIPSWRSMKVIAAALVGLGASGALAESFALPWLVSVPLAATGGLAAGAGALELVLKPLARQQYNSLMSRYSYIGCHALVTLDILSQGTGQVTFRDRQGARVNQAARSDLGHAVPKGASVMVVALAPDAVVVHYNPLSA